MLQMRGHFILSKIGGWILLLQLCYPVIPGADRRLSQMARSLSKDSSTISKEIRRHRFLVPYYQFENSSKRYSFYCLDFSPVIYPQLLNPFYVCNSCSKLRICSIVLRYFSIVNLDFPQKLLPSILSM